MHRQYLDSTPQHFPCAVFWQQPFWASSEQSSLACTGILSEKPYRPVSAQDGFSTVLRHASLQITDSLFPSLSPHSHALNALNV